MKILIPGGHLTPALAFIDYIQAHHPDDDIIFVGRTYSQKNAKQRSNEQEEIDRRNIPFISFNAVKISEIFSWRVVWASLEFVWSLVVSVYLLLRHRPDKIVSFGGYMAVPIALAGALLRIPIVTHEQTTVMGHATQIVARVAKYVGLSRPISNQPTPQPKFQQIGNLTRQSLWTRQPQPDWVPDVAKLPLVYVTGGNQGSEVLNQVIDQSLEWLTQKFLVVHQCGNPTSHRNYREDLEARAQELPSTRRNRYVVKEWISDQELGWIYQNAAGVISRAGANTLDEIAAANIPALIIPLPFAYQDEQLKNARSLAKEQSGVEILEQKNFSSTSLRSTLQNWPPKRKKLSAAALQAIQERNSKTLAAFYTLVQRA